MTQVGTPSPEKARTYILEAIERGSVVFDWLHQRPDGTQWDGECHLMGFESEGRSLMQFTLLASAMGFWIAVRRTSPTTAMGAILITTVLMGLLGALITFAVRPLYAPHFASTLSWGVAPLEDQQLAGITMWAPGSIAYLAAAMWIGWRWLNAERARGLRAGPV